MSLFTLQPIGVIRTPFKSVKGMPIQPTGAVDVAGQVVVDQTYAEGLDDIEGFSHIILLYLFHHSKGFELQVKPFLDDKPHGLFATRAPRRPNPVGLSVVPLLRREANVLHVGAIDVVDQTPLIDIKPYVPAFDAPAVTAVGWLAGKTPYALQVRADSRFEAD